MFEDCPAEYLRNNNKIQKQFLNYLEECGINIELKSNIQFDDKAV